MGGVGVVVVVVVGRGVVVVVVVGVIAVTAVVVVCLTKRNNRANEYKSKGGGAYDTEVHVVSVEDQDKAKSDDPYEMNIEMTSTGVSNNKEDEHGPEPEHESEPTSESLTTEDSQKSDSPYGIEEY